jgi:polysaccharide chain length determinant protein (PEP-CTERM system associated)
MLGQRQLSPEEYLDIWRRRKTWFVVSVVFGTLMGFGLTLVLPAKYTSSTLVLVEQPKVPENIIKSGLNDPLGQRLATMQEQILSRTRLQPLIERFNLYPADQRKKIPMEELVAQMRKNIAVTPIKPTPGSKPDALLPGFTISFTAEEPKVAQQICQEITSMFIEENLKIREQRAQGTTDFLIKQLEEAKRDLDQQDSKMADFKRRYSGQLPGQETGNNNLLMSLNAQLEAATSTLNRTQQDKAFSESLLAQEVAAWQASQTGSNPIPLEQQLIVLEGQLVTLEGRYTPDHPDVIKARSDVAQLKKRIEEANKLQNSKTVDAGQKVNMSEPPPILNLRTQIHQYKQTIAEKTREQQRLQQQINIYQARVAGSPMVEEQYKELSRDYNISLSKYDDLLQKKNTSEMTTDLERRMQGEQFKVMDAPNLPEAASFPNPLYFTLGGLAGGFALGFGLMGLLEFRDKALRNERDIEFFLELPTLALLPAVGPQVVNRNGGFWKFGKAARSSARASATGLEG